MHTIEELRQMLLGFKWEQFGEDHPARNPWILQGVEFHARVGIHLGRPAIAIIAQGCFVAIKHFTLHTSYHLGNDWVLNPADPDSAKIIAGWGEWTEDCGLDHTDRIIKEQDHAHASGTASDAPWQDMDWHAGLG